MFCHQVFRGFAGNLGHLRVSKEVAGCEMITTDRPEVLEPPMSHLDIPSPRRMDVTASLGIGLAFHNFDVGEYFTGPILLTM